MELKQLNTIMSTITTLHISTLSLVKTSNSQVSMVKLDSLTLLLEVEHSEAHLTSNTLMMSLASIREKQPCSKNQTQRNHNPLQMKLD